MKTLVRITPNWWRDAACAQIGSEYFFRDDTDDESTKGHVPIARKICASCPVILECRESLVKEAVGGQRGEPCGFRAGMTARQQRRFVKARINAVG